jgi:tripartite-type tricarboxylate transporter receptor subunit TctC
MTIKRRALLLAAACMPFIGAPASDALAQAYPARPITLVVGFPPGGASDIMGRLFGDKIGELIGQRIVVDNKGGAGGTIAGALVAKAPADGYTLMIGSVSTHAIAPNLYTKLSYDTLKEFAPVSLLVSAPIVLVVNPNVSANSMAELVALYKKEPGKHNYATGGNGTHAHLASEWFKMEAGVDVVHVPFRGGGPALQAVISGEAGMIVDNVQTVVPHVAAGKLKALAVMSGTRSPLLANVPTMVEQGFKGFVTDSWTAIYAPAGTPADVIDKLAKAGTVAAKDAGVGEKLKAMSADGVGAGPAELDKLWRAEYARWGELIRALNLKVD